MAPSVLNINEENGILTFELDNVNVSIANAIRRTILSEIPSVIFRSFPHEENKVNIIKNTSRFTNEILKQRMSCIPVYLDPSAPYNDFTIEVSVRNNTDQIQYVTTENFIIKNKQTGEKVSQAETSKLFPKNKLTGDYILFARLMPGTENKAGEEIILTAELDVGIAKESGMFTVASTSSYFNTIDRAAAEQAWEQEKLRITTDEEYSAEELESERRNWMILNEQRHFKPDSFSFTVETIGFYSNEDLVIKACDVVIDKIENFNRTLQSKTVKIEQSNTTMENCYDITLEGEDYTLGKVLEYLLYSQYYEGDEILNYCGFKKFHPHDTDSVIRIAYKNNEPTNIIIDNLIGICNSATKIFTQIKAEVVLNEANLSDFNYELSTIRLDSDITDSDASTNILTVLDGTFTGVTKNNNTVLTLYLTKNPDSDMGGRLVKGREVILRDSTDTSKVVKVKLLNHIGNTTIVDGGAGFRVGDKFFVKDTANSIPIQVSKIQSGEIEIAPLAFMRGRTLKNSFAILDEAQNATDTQIKMFLTRIGENSKIVINGDPSQIDLPNKSMSGLNRSKKLLGNLEEISVVDFDHTDVVRHPLVSKIVKAYSDQNKDE